jgi:hypothetical protein
MVSESRGRLQYDFAVYDSHGRLSALVEAKRRFGTDVRWAREWHATAAERAKQSSEANVVLVTPERVYVWRSGASESAQPDWTLQAGPWLAPYFARLKIGLKEVDPRVFEEIVGLCLQDVVLGTLPEGPNAGGDGAELLDALRGGEVVQQAAA